MLNYSQDKREWNIKKERKKERKVETNHKGGATQHNQKERKSNSNSPVMDNASEQPQK